MNELELRCLKFGLLTRDYCRSIKNDTINLVYIKQIVRSSSSIGANYIEANENLGKQDLLMKLKISRREAKETIYWAEMLHGENDQQRAVVKQEAEELKKIFSAIINKLNGN